MEAEAIQLALKGKPLEGADLAMQALHLRRLADEVRKRTHLPKRRKVGTLLAVDAIATPSRGANISAAKTVNPWPWQKALQTRGLSIPEWVLAKGKKGPRLETARSWVKAKGRGGRAIPALWAERLAEEFEDPALLLPESWPCGIR